jgi:hypothetical protein
MLRRKTGLVPIMLIKQNCLKSPDLFVMREKTPERVFESV